jgi:hypothetical protein
MDPDGCAFDQNLQAKASFPLLMSMYYLLKHLLPLALVLADQDQLTQTPLLP